MAHGMRVEGADDDRPPLMGAALHRPANDRLVTEVKSGEIAERDDRTAKCFRNGLVERQALHGLRLAKARALANAAFLTHATAKPTCCSSRSTGLPAAHSCARRFWLWKGSYRSTT